MAGYATRDKNGTVEEGESAASPRWAAVVNRTPGPTSFPPDTTDGELGIDGLLTFSLDSYGPAAGTWSVRGHALDNEPALKYYAAHPRLFTHRLTVSEVRMPVTR